MTLEQQVCSLEVAQRLRELRVKQESLCDWCEIDDGDWIVMVRRQKEFATIKEQYGEMDGCISAFTVAELGDMLPLDFWVEDKRYFLGIDVSGAGSKDWVIGYYHEGRTPAGFNDTSPDTKTSGTEADARAKMLVYLLENELIKL
jgi:hypothetical protein